jgi:hypothetical protein
MAQNLLVTSQLDKTVREYDGTTGVFVKVAASGGAMGDPLGLAIGLDGNPTDRRQCRHRPAGFRSPLHANC